MRFSRRNQPVVAPVLSTCTGVKGGAGCSCERPHTSPFAPCHTPPRQQHDVDGEAMADRPDAHAIAPMAPLQPPAHILPVASLGCVLQAPSPVVQLPTPMGLGLGLVHMGALPQALPHPHPHPQEPGAYDASLGTAEVHQALLPNPLDPPHQLLRQPEHPHPHPHPHPHQHYVPEHGGVPGSSFDPDPGPGPGPGGDSNHAAASGASSTFVTAAAVIASQRSPGKYTAADVRGDEDASHPPAFDIAAIIYVAINDAKKHRAHVGEIYERMMQRWAYYRYHASPATWKQKVRCVLTTKSYFTKCGHAGGAGTGGRGGCWEVDEAAALLAITFRPRSRGSQVSAGLPGPRAEPGALPGLTKSPGAAQPLCYDLNDHLQEPPYNLAGAPLAS